MAEQKTKAKTTKAAEPAAPAEQPTAAEPAEMVDIGEAAASGEFAYAGPLSDPVADDRPPAEQAGTAKHLGQKPYAGSPYAGD